MASTAVLRRTPSSPAKKNREERIRQLKTIVRDQNVDEDDEEKIRNKELGILKLGELYQKEGRAEEIADLIKQTRPFLRLISKAKAAKLVRSLVDLFLDLESGIGIEVDLCRECIEWAREERRTFLRQSLESRLVALYLDRGMYKDALVMCCGLLKELKKMDDKALLVEVRLLESKTYHALGNVPRAKAALISARADANAIYCPPLLQAALDMQSGILHAADDGDFQTALSYFYEAFRGYDDFCPKRALMALKYMLLSKVMLRQTHDMDKLMGGRLTLKYSGRDLDAMVAIGKASSDRSLADFQSSVKSFKHELEDDPVVKAHLGALYNNMVEQNLCRIVEPYSRIEVDFISKTIRLPVQQVEHKLTEMILDDKLKATLDKGSVLIVFDETPADRTYDLAIETIHSMAKVVDALYLKAKKLS